MTAALSGHEPLVDQWVAAVDAAVALQGETADDLRQVPAAVASRDPAALERLGDRLRCADARLAEAAVVRDRLRACLAAALGCPPADVTLRRLAARADDGRAAGLRRLRERVLAASDALRVQHLRAATLLDAYARAHHAVLVGLLRQGGDARTYRTDGTTPWWTERGLLDARR